MDRAKLERDKMRKMEQERRRREAQVRERGWQEWRSNSLHFSKTKLT